LIKGDGGLVEDTGEFGFRHSFRLAVGNAAEGDRKKQCGLKSSRSEDIQSAFSQFEKRLLTVDMVEQENTVTSKGGNGDEITY
jgi:hypothetical protein